MEDLLAGFCTFFTSASSPDDSGGRMIGTDNTALCVFRASVRKFQRRRPEINIGHSRALSRTLFGLSDTASLAKFAGIPSIVALETISSVSAQN
jgi:hypothetical protein